MSKYVHMFETSYICQNSKYVHMLPVPNMWTNLVREYSKVPPPPKDPNPPIVTLLYLLYWYSCSSKDPPPDYRNSPHIHDTQNLVTADIRCTQVLSIRSQFWIQYLTEARIIRRPRNLWKRSTLCRFHCHFLGWDVLTCTSLTVFLCLNFVAHKLELKNWTVTFDLRTKMYVGDQQSQAFTSLTPTSTQQSQPPPKTHTHTWREDQRSGNARSTVGSSVVF